MFNERTLWKRKDQHLQWMSTEMLLTICRMSSILSWASSCSSWERALEQRRIISTGQCRVGHNRSGRGTARVKPEWGKKIRDYNKNKRLRRVLKWKSAQPSDIVSSCFARERSIVYLNMLAVAFLSWGRRSGSLRTSSRRQITDSFSSPFISKSWAAGVKKTNKPRSLLRTNHCRLNLNWQAHIDSSTVQI